MSKERLAKYPITKGPIYDGADVEMRLVECEEVKTTGINGKILVYILSEDCLNRNSDEIKICGYRRTTIFSQKIRIIPENEREVVKSKLLEILSDRKNIKSVEFWN